MKATYVMLFVVLAVYVLEATAMLSGMMMQSHSLGNKGDYKSYKGWAVRYLRGDGQFYGFSNLPFFIKWQRLKKKSKIADTFF